MFKKHSVFENKNFTLGRIEQDCAIKIYGYRNICILTIKWTSVSVSVMFLLYTVVLYYILLLISQYRVHIFLLSNARKYSKKSSFLMTSIEKLACALSIFDIFLGLLYVYCYRCHNYINVRQCLK